MDKKEPSSNKSKSDKHDDYNKNPQQQMQFLDDINCKFNHAANFICFSDQCEKYPFMCSQKLCQCKTPHEDCLRFILQDFMQKLKKKTLATTPLIDQHDKMVDSFIDKVIQQASKIKQEFRLLAQSKYKFCQLTQDEKQIWQKISENKVNDLKGKQFYKICCQMFNKNKNKKQQKNSVLEEEVNILAAQWKNLQNKLMNDLNLIHQKISSNQILKELVKTDSLQNSRILTTLEERKVLEGFFDKKIVQVQLLYRASQNDFKLQNFYKNCTRIPNTLTLIQTEFKKKIGGFTPLFWKKAQADIKLSDPSNSTFIFSITNNQKFKQFDLKCGIKNIVNIGPTFGRYDISSDICITSESNKYQSYSYFNNGYINQNYKQRNSKSIEKFTGNPNNSINFRTKQWEVWRILFQ